MDIFTTILYPLIAGMEIILDFVQRLIGSWGLSILFLSFAMSLLLFPLQKIGRKLENKIQLRTSKVSEAIGQLDKSLKGEERFNKVDKIYRSHGYHPIQQMLGASSMLIILPALISAVILFNQHQGLPGQSFLMLSDLSKPDQLVFGLNILPVVMFLVTLFDAFIRFNGNKPASYRFLLLYIVLVALDL